MADSQVVERVRKELESVPWTHGCNHLHFLAHEGCRPDYQALAEKVEGWIEPLETAARRLHEDVFLNIVDTDAHFENWQALRRALAALPWRQA